MGALDQELAKEDITCPGYMKLWIAVAGLASFRRQTQVRADVPTSIKALGIFQSNDIGEGSQRTNAVHLSETPSCRVTFSCKPVDFVVIAGYLLRQLADRLEDRAKCRLQTFG